MEEESLPLTGPMYIISEARMETERIRERTTGKEWRKVVEWEQKHQVDRLKIKLYKKTRGRQNRKRQIEEHKNKEILGVSMGSADCQPQSG